MTTFNQYEVSQDDLRGPSRVDKCAQVEAAAVALLNSPVLTDYGYFAFERISPKSARTLIARRGWHSAMGHAASAQAFSRLLEINCPMNRIRYVQAPGEQALVLRLLQRLPEGSVLDIPQLEAVGYEIGLLTRLG
jgi:hypothetical protein